MAKCRVQLGVSGCRCQAQWGCNGGAESSLAETQWGLRLGLTLEVMRAAAGGAGWEGCSGNREVRCCSWTPQREALSAGVRSWSEAATAGGALRGHHLLRPQAPPLPPPSSSSPPARPIRSPRHRRAGLLVWPAEAERDFSKPRRPPTRDEPDSRDPALPPRGGPLPVVAGTLRPEPRFSSSSSRRGRDGESGAAALERASRGPCPGGSGLEERRRRRREVRVTPGRRVFHLQAEAAAASCVKAAAAAAVAAGSGAGRAPWPWREDPDPGTPGALLSLFGLLCRHLN